IEPSASRSPDPEEVLTVRPLLSRVMSDGQLELAAAGSWTAPHAAELERLVDSMAGDAVAINMGAIEAFDTYGAWLLERLRRASEVQGQGMRVLALAERYQPLLDEVHR